MMNEERVAIVTAASKGMGAACARELADRGYRVVVMARSGSVMNVAESLSGVGVMGSVTDPADLQRLVQAALDAYGRIDGVVNNTGHPAKGPLLDISDAAWHEGLDLTLLNVVRMVRIVAPVMAEQGGGSIVNISTFGAIEPSLAYPVSCSLRAALGNFTRLFAREYADRNVRMNDVLPGFIDSYPVDEKTVDAIPMKRPGTVAEVAKTVAYLLSGDSSYVTGQSMVVDGGLTGAR
jgi:NAD(P)-dependent dehydrogenase (short-subunit alcohol dehydrogenase family)